ncbi:MerR family transcriptional regulator [Kitasatospora sp. NPDC056783]|uniref:MerR family transcriptional regulator n=1 Tax=Kitasatospora sp. NPDC056783 TaxID=3345943 RepID=UPI00368D84F4
MRIADAAARVGVPAHRLRHYEATGLLIPERSRAGYRDYTPEDVERAQQIRALLDSGFTANDVALMLPCLRPDPDDDRRCCDVTRARLTRRLAEIQERREQLQRTEQALTSWLATPVEPPPPATP